MSQAIVHAALSAAHTYGEKIAALQAIYKGKKPEAVRAALLPQVASFPKYKVPVVPGAGKAEGTMVLDSEHKNYEACRKALGRLVKDIVGGGSAKAEAPDLVAQALRLISKMTAAQRRKVLAAL